MMPPKKSPLKARSKVKSVVPSHSDDLTRLSRIRGQIDGIERMINERRYCPDIMNQIRSASSALRAVEKQMMHRHLEHCVKAALSSGDKRDSDTKMSELMALFDR
jgi:DNA-binding FrmR family transcriptional regulator